MASVRVDSLDYFSPGQGLSMLFGSPEVCLLTYIIVKNQVDH